MKFSMLKVLFAFATVLVSQAAHAGDYGLANESDRYFSLDQACRVKDTRESVPEFANGTRKLISARSVGGNCGVANYANAAVLSITALQSGTNSGYLKVYRKGAAQPVSTIQIGTTNDVIVKLEGIDFEIAAFGGGTMHYIVEVAGYFVRSSPASSQYLRSSAPIVINSGETITVDSSNNTNDPGYLQCVFGHGIVPNMGGCAASSGHEFLRLIGSQPLPNNGHRCTYHATGQASFVVTGYCKPSEHLNPELRSF